MSVGRPRWTSPPTCSIACWTWDARTPSALRNLGPGGGQLGPGGGQCGRPPDPCTTLAACGSSTKGEAQRPQMPCSDPPGIDNEAHKSEVVEIGMGAALW